MSYEELPAGAVLPLGTEGAGERAVPLTARSYTHPGLDDRVVVRLVAGELGAAEDLAAGYLGLEPAAEPVEVGLGARQALGFPELRSLGDAVHITYSPVDELNLLKEFQDEVGYENFAQGFGLTEFGDISGLSAWSEDPEFTGRLIPFAQATAGGSFYALWRLDDREGLASLPVVVFGDEGGEHVVARGVRELFQLLGFDEEISVEHEKAYYYRDEDERHTDCHDAYVAWLGRHFGLPVAQDPDAVLAAAQTEWGQRFADWIRPFLR